MKKEEIYVVIDDEQKRQRAIQILTDAKEEIDWRNFELSEILRVNSVDKDWFLTEAYFGKSLKEITLDQLEQLLNPKLIVKEVHLSIEELQKQAKSLGFDLVKKERKIKVGDFGKFWDEIENDCYFGFLITTKQVVFKYRTKSGGSFRNFAHLTDEEKQQIQENW